MRRMMADKASLVPESISLPPAAPVLVHDLSIFSLLPILRAVLRNGNTHVFFRNSSKLGLQAANLLHRLSVLKKPVSHLTNGMICPIDDSEHSREFVMRTSLYTALTPLARHVNELVDRYMPQSDQFYRHLLCANILKRLAAEMHVQEHLIAYASRLEDAWGCSSTVILSAERIKQRDTRLRGEHKTTTGKLTVQFVPSNVLLFRAIAHCLRMAAYLLSSKRRGDLNEHEKMIGTAAVWGVDTSRMNDFFWCQYTGINPRRLRYLFERPDVSPTVSEAVSEARERGISSVYLNESGRAETNDVCLPPDLSARTALRTVALVLRSYFLASRADKLSRLVLLHLAQEELVHVFKSSQFQALDLGVLWHYHEGGPDNNTGAIHLAGGIRFATHFSCNDSPREEQLKTQHIYFPWGLHDAKIFVDSGSISSHMLLAGCAVHEERSQDASRELARETVASLHQRGAKYILALFDNATPTPNVYRFFLQWIIEDPSLGILLKPKKIQWREMYPGFEDLFAQAFSTDRVHAFDTVMWPADVALAADFAIGHTGISATVVSALAGARVLNLEYDGLDREPLTQYATLHSLGPNRCVFRDHETLKNAVLDYFQDRSSNPQLGDISPVLDHFDPFRDGKASRRIGEYVEWYLEGVDRGVSRETALKRATHNYADKWGADKVVRGL